VALIGDQQSGKTSFMKKYTSGSCPNYYEPTLGVDCGEKHIQSKGTLVHITFWDFSGKMDFLELRN
jgi:GTPase SAR1 family protein